MSRDWSVDQTVTLEVSATVTGHACFEDYGVPRSSFEEVADLEVTEIRIGDQDYDRARLVSTFGKQGADALLKLVIASADPSNWDG